MTQSVEASRWSRAESRLAGPVLLFVIIVGMFWKLTLTKQYTWMNNPDCVNQILPWYQFQARAWHSGQFPLWDPHEWGGQSVMGQVQTGAAYPLNWILFLLPLKHGWINRTYLHWYFVIIHYMGALFCFLLLRDLKRSLTASLLGASAFATAGYFEAIDWPQMLNGAVWAPLVFLYFLRAMRGERPLANSALSGMFLGVSLLSGHHQIPTYIGIAMAGLWTYHLVKRWIGGNLRPALAGLGLFAIFAVLAGGLQELPAVEYGRLAVRWVGSSHDPLSWNEPVPYSVHATFSLPPGAISNLLIPGESDIIYMSLAMFALAVFAIASAWQEPMVRLFAALALGGLLFSFGQFTILHGLIYALAPLVEKARTPSMAALFYNLGICVLAAYGLDAYRAAIGHQQNAWMRRLVWILAAVGGLVVLYIFIYSPQKLEHPPNFNWLGMYAVIAILLAAVLHGWNRGHFGQRAGAVVVTLVALMALGSLTGWRWPARDQGWSLLDPMSQNADVAEFLRRQPGMVRIDLDRSETPYNFGDWQGIDGFECYAGLTRNIETARANGRIHMMFGMNFYLGSKPRPDTAQTPVFTGKSGMKVWIIPGAFPRAWSVHEAVGIHAEAEIMEDLNKSPAELARQTFMYGTPPKLETCAGPDDVTLVARETNGLTVDANLRCKGMVIVGEGYFPGWQATVDGTPAPVYEAYTFLRGVVAGAGRHRIEMRYRPRSVFWGGAMSAIGILGGCLLAVLWKR